MAVIRQINSDSINRVMQCDGGFKAVNRVDDATNPVALEGKVAIALIRTMLSETDYVNPYEHMVTDEIRFDVGNAVRFIKRLGTKISTNVMFRLGGVSGRANVVVETPKEVYVIDFNYGYKPVDETRDWRTLVTAAGISKLHSQKQCNIVVIQPRSLYAGTQTIRTFVPPREFLKTVEKKVKERFEENIGHNTGEECKNCPLAAGCEALSKASMNAVDVAMTDVQESENSDEFLSKHLDTLIRSRDIIEVRIKSVEQTITDRIQKGSRVPGWALENRKSNRKWIDKDVKDLIESLCGISITEEKLITPRQAIIKGVPEQIIQNTTESEIIGTKLIKT